jgi:hypothetical protein
MASFGVEVTAPGLDERHEAGLFRAVKACLIHNTLLGQPNIEIMIRTRHVAGDSAVPLACNRR